ncbi:LysR family glycine cleavage system transcriptional activator [Bradyrhizobium sp. USDA 326]|uniref:LysR family transcriptional regulator n=1 Tax=Bradyrhizobium sp. USDA 326 TaxID=3377726 RepID=UPI003C792CCE
MPDQDDNRLPLNAIRAFVKVSRERSVTRAASALGLTQSSVSRHLSVLEEYLGAELIKRQGRGIELTDFGRLFADTVAEPLDVISFAARRMRRRSQSDANRIVVSSSLPTFAYALLIPNIQSFSTEAGGAIVDVMSSLSLPSSPDSFDVLITRNLAPIEEADDWEIYREHLVCVGAPGNVTEKGTGVIKTLPMLTVTSRPDILPTWLKSQGLSPDEITLGARYDHHYLALPAVLSGNSLLVAPEIVIAGLVRGGLLRVLPNSRVPSGKQYHAYSLDRSDNPDLARAFCRWLVRLCRQETKLIPSYAW